MKLIKNNSDVILTVLIALNFIILFFATMVIIWIMVRDEKVTNNVQIEYVEKIRYATEQEQIEHDKQEIEMIAKTVWGEARGCSKTEKAAVVWCILNRVDDDRFLDNIADVITQKNQFTGYSENHPIEPEIVDLVNDVMTRWVFEKTAVGSVGRVLPKEYCWFLGDGESNTFRDAYKGDYNTWDWSLESPYKEN